MLVSFSLFGLIMDLHFHVIKASTVRVDWKWIRSGKGKFWSCAYQPGITWASLSGVEVDLKTPEMMVGVHGDSQFMDYEL